MNRQSSAHRKPLQPTTCVKVCWRDRPRQVGRQVGSVCEWDSIEKGKGRAWLGVVHLSHQAHHSISFVQPICNNISSSNYYYLCISFSLRVPTYNKYLCLFRVSTLICSCLFGVDNDFTCICRVTFSMYVHLPINAYRNIGRKVTQASTYASSYVGK